MNRNGTTNDLPESIDGNENNGPFELVCPVGEPRCVSYRVLGRPRTKVCNAADGKEDEGRKGGQYLPGGIIDRRSWLDMEFFVIEQRALFVAVGNHGRGTT